MRTEADAGRSGRSVQQVQAAQSSLICAFLLGAARTGSAHSEVSELDGRGYAGIRWL